MKPKNLRWVAPLLALAASVCAIERSAAAVLVYDGNRPFTAPMNPAVNLTTTGTVDWAFWESSSGTVVTAPLAPTGRRATGNLISSLSAVGGPAGSGLRGSTTADAVGSYTWDNGTSAGGLGIGENYNLAGGLVFNSALNTAGSGFSMTVRGNPAQDYYVVLYFGGFAATGNLSLSLNGALSPTITPYTFAGNNPKQVVAYEFHFRPDNINDLVTIQYTASATSANGHLGIEAVTVGLLPVYIPEPTSLALCGLGGLLLIGRRRR